ncbi:hypothetical protein E3Q08_03108 [Wallemia mellicola]|nr:hypothetical protein E3Q08_03108 [Wallemia mellicola]
MVATDKKIFLQSASDKPNRVRGMGYSSLWAYFGPKVQITQPFNHSTSGTHSSTYVHAVMAKSKNKGIRFIPFTSKSSMSSTSSSLHVPKVSSTPPHVPSTDFTFQHKQPQRQPSQQQKQPTLPPDHQVLATLHSHIYFQGFLLGVGSDVKVKVPKWGRLYRLHKIILTQSTFFNSLFQGAFLETNNNEITLTFDDPNITRSSFEYCLGYLYGKSSNLVLDSKFKPTPQYPLTPSYPTFEQPQSNSSNTQLATPEFCVSLIATAIYLGCPSIANKALNFILASISPINVSFFLKFALGEGLGAHRHWYPGEQEAAVGMEEIGLVMEKCLDTHIETSESEATPSGVATPISASHENNLDKLSTIDIASKTEDYSVDSDTEDYIPSFHYGAASDKVGEACVCWLSRWALEIIEIEDILVNDDGEITHPSGCIPFATWSLEGIPAKWIRAVISSDSLFVPGGEWQRYKLASRIVELRRRQNKGALSYSDECEFDRMFADGIYYTHMTFEQLSIIQREMSPTTGRPYVPIRILQQALWSHSELQNRIEVSSKTSAENSDLSLTFNSWEIREKLRSKDGKAWSEKRFFPVGKDSTERLGDATSMYHSDDDLNKFVSPPTGHRQNEDDASGLAGSTHDPLVGVSSSSHRRPHTEAQLFGVQKSHKTGLEISKLIEADHNPTTDVGDTISIASSSPTAKRAKEDRWTLIEPLRFSVEYWIKSELEPREKKFSHAVFYAGSFINTYIQINEQKHKHGNQLGIYVHRQSMDEPLPYASSPPNAANGSGNVVSPLLNNNNTSSAVPLSPASTMDTILRVNSAGSDDSQGSNSNNQPAPQSPPSDTAKVGPGKHSGSQNVPFAPYKDTRKTMRAFFAVQCSSGNGTAFTKFSSAPDNFTTSQSWGWKSSVQRSSEYLANHNVGPSEQLGVLNSLRAVVSVGLV